MKKPFKIILGLIFTCVLIVMAVRSTFIIFSMPNDTMSPIVPRNSVVVGLKWFHRHSLRNGDIVMVDLPLTVGPTFAVRMVKQQTNTPPDYIFIRAANTNGIDSVWLGPLPKGDIKAKVIWIFK